LASNIGVQYWRAALSLTVACLTLPQKNSAPRDKNQETQQHLARAQALHGQAGKALANAAASSAVTDGLLGGSGNSVAPPQPSVQPEACAICKNDDDPLSPGDTDYAMTPCNHGPFHLSCLAGHLNCPTCRKPIGPSAPWSGAPAADDDSDQQCHACGGSGDDDPNDDWLVKCSHDLCNFKIHRLCCQHPPPLAVLLDGSSTAPQFYCPAHVNRCLPIDFKLEANTNFVIQAQTTPAARAARLQARTQASAAIAARSRADDIQDVARVLKKKYSKIKVFKQLRRRGIVPRLPRRGRRPGKMKNPMFFQLAEVLVA